MEATDEANAALNYFGTWQMVPSGTPNQLISLDLTGNVGTLELKAWGYSSGYAEYPVAFTIHRNHGQHTPPATLSLGRFVALCC